MAERTDKERLARLLSEMADGRHTDEGDPGVPTSPQSGYEEPAAAQEPVGRSAAGSVPPASTAGRVPVAAGRGSTVAATVSQRPAPVGAPRRPITASHRHLVQTILFKQTIIPVLLILGILCLAIVALGWMSPEDSPFIGFRKLYFSIPATLIGLMLTALGVLTMFQVKHDLARMTSEGCGDIVR